MLFSLLHFVPCVSLCCQAPNAQSKEFALFNSFSRVPGAWQQRQTELLLLLQPEYFLVATNCLSARFGEQNPVYTACSSISSLSCNCAVYTMCIMLLQCVYTIEEHILQQPMPAICRDQKPSRCTLPVQQATCSLIGCFGSTVFYRSYLFSWPTLGYKSSCRYRQT